MDGVSPGTRSALFAVLLVAFGIKAAVFPLSTWLPDSYPTAPAPVTAVFAGLLTKVGVYAIIRAHTLLFPGAGLDRMLMVAAFLTMIVGILGAIAQSDIKRLLSFTLVSHIGYMVFGVALSSQLGMSGAIFYVAHHILVQTTLFLVVGLIERQAGGSTLQRLGGLAAASPVLAFVFVVPALNLGGVPPFSGFIGKVALLEAGAQSGSVLAWLLVGGQRGDQPVDAVCDFPRVDTGVLAHPRRRTRGSSRGGRAFGVAGRHRGHRAGRPPRRRPDADRHAGADRRAHRGGA
jgi:multicomponent Na+:H+ antiporter subunit D